VGFGPHTTSLRHFFKVSSNFTKEKITMNNSDLKNLLNESRRKQDPLQVALLSFLLGEFELQNSKNSNVTVDQIVYKAIENNQTCLEARHDEKLVAENQFFSSLLPNYLSVAELRGHLGPLNLGSDGKSMGAAIKHLRANGLDFRNSDIKFALDNEDRSIVKGGEHNHYDR